MELYITITAALGNFILILFILLKNYKSASNRLLALLVYFIGLYPVFNYLSLHAQTDEQAFLWTKFILFTAIPAGPLFLLFVKTFPETKIQLKKTYLILLSFWILINIILAYFGLIFSGVSIVDGNPIISPGPAVASFGLLQIISVVLGSIALTHKYKNATGLFKLQLRYITYGLLISFGLTAFSTIFLPLVFKFTLLIPLSPLFLLLASLSISYSILRHRLLDIRLVLARTVTYTLFLILSGVVYLLILYLLTTFFTIPKGQSTTLAITSVLLSVIVAFSFQNLKKILEKVTDRIFYKYQYDTQKVLYNLTYIMASTMSLEQLTHNLLQEVLKHLRINHGAFILIDNGQVYQVAHEGYVEIPEYDESKVLDLMEAKQMLIFNEMSESTSKSVMREMELGMSIRLQAENKEIGLLTLGEKLSGDIYSENDIKLLEIFAPEAAVAIENAKSYQEIKRFNITLKEQIAIATKDLQGANERLKQLDQLKDEFVSLASHELRTPMTAIKSYLWLFLETKDLPLNDKQKTYIERAYQATDRLIALVNDMLNVSRIESGRMNILIKPFNAIKLTQEVIEELKPTADKQKISIIFSPNTEKLPDVLGDQNKIREVLVNLIGNSIKFTPENGSITVNINRKEQFLIYQIKDTGKGISQEDLSKLFQKFQTVGNNYLTKMNTQGTGLGLYLSKSIVEMHGGSIWAESEGEGKGATFSFSLKTV